MIFLCIGLRFQSTQAGLNTKFLPPVVAESKIFRNFGRKLGIKVKPKNLTIKVKPSGKV